MAEMRAMMHEQTTSFVSDPFEWNHSSIVMLVQIYVGIIIVNQYALRARLRYLAARFWYSYNTLQSTNASDSALWPRLVVQYASQSGVPNAFANVSSSLQICIPSI